MECEPNNYGLSKGFVGHTTGTREFQIKSRVERLELFTSPEGSLALKVSFSEISPKFLNTFVF